MTLAEKIFTLRKKNGLSQDELAGELGVTRQAVYKWESGIASPEIDKLKSLSKLFNVSFDYLLNDEIDKYNDKEKIDSTAKKPAYRSVFRLGEKMLANQPSIDRGYLPERKRKTDMSDAYFARRKKAAEEGMNAAGATEILFVSNRRTSAFFYDEVKKAIGFYYGSAVQLVCPIENLAGFSFNGGNSAVVNSRAPILGVSPAGLGIGSAPSLKSLGRSPVQATLLYHDGEGISEFPLVFIPWQDYMAFNFNANLEMINLVENADTNAVLDNLNKIQMKIEALRDSAQILVNQDTPDIDPDFYQEKNKATLNDYAIFKQRVIAEINGVRANVPKQEPKEKPIHVLSQELPEKSNHNADFISGASDFLSGAGRYLLLVLFLIVQGFSMLLLPSMIAYILILMLIGLIPAFIAKNKGRYFIKWWIYGTYLFLIALIHSLVISPDY